MTRKCVVFIFFLLFAFSFSAFAQDEDLKSALDYKVQKMQKELQLTDSQVTAIRPVVQDYLMQHDALMRDTAGQGIVDHVSVKSALKALREKEYQGLGKILSPEQLKKLINKDRLAAIMNPDNPESFIDDGGPGITAGGASLKF
ncbi:MAG: hypothetical protein HQL13_02945 [Candidatus Omnitrophica bacterium]|nr:hypothetical protein [Candidatus Omnitrophota bacterium]